MTDTNPESPPAVQRSPRWLKPVVLIAALGLGAFLFLQYRQELSLENLARRETALRALLDERPAAVYGGAFLLYVAVTALSLPGAGVLSLAYGWFFKFWPALLLVSFASTIGATVAFLLSRFLFRVAVQRAFGARLAGFNDALRREGAFYLFTLRLIPAIPFFVINLVMGLTPLKVRTFWWVSQLGMLPGTAVYVYAGSSVGTIEEVAQRGAAGVLKPQTIFALALLGLFPLIVKWAMNALQAKREKEM